MSIGWRVLGALAVVSIGVLGTPQPGDTQELTFVVPVRLAGLHSDMTEGGVGCGIFDAGGVTQLGATGTVRFPISGGSYSGELTLRGGVAPGVDPARATRYICSLTLYIAGRPVPVFDLLEGRGARPEYQIRTSDFRGSTSGPIPR